jgi:hypothetical protein
MTTTGDTPELTRVRTVLARDTEHERFTHLSGREQVKFHSPPDSSRAYVLLLDVDVDNDLDHPDRITVTVEPGDRLNAAARCKCSRVPGKGWPQCPVHGESLGDGCRGGEHSPAANPDCIMSPAGGT